MKEMVTLNKKEQKRLIVLGAPHQPCNTPLLLFGAYCPIGEMLPEHHSVQNHMSKVPALAPGKRAEG